MFDLDLALRRHRRQLGRRGYVDEVFCFRYRAADQYGQVIRLAKHSPLQYMPKNKKRI
jgi:hypothetical protein